MVKLLLTTAAITGDIALAKGFWSLKQLCEGFSADSVWGGCANPRAGGSVQVGHVCRSYLLL